MPNAIPPTLRHWLESARDWSQTDLGPVNEWPPDLTTAVASCLPLGPVALLWGPRFLRLYGSDYAPLLRDRHPQALGMPAESTWPAEQWAVVAPHLERVLATGDVVRAELALDLDREGWLERVFLQVTYTPVCGHRDGEVLGIAATALDRTAEVLGRQRAEALACLGVVSVENRSPASVARRAMEGLLTADNDVGSGEIVLIHADGTAGSGTEQTPPSATTVTESVHASPPDGLALLVAQVRLCLKRGCIQSAAGCRFETTHTPRPTADDVAERGIGLWPAGEHSAGQCRKLPGKGPADDVGRLVITLGPRTRQDDQQAIFLAKATDLVARAVRDARAESTERDRVRHLEVALASNRAIGAAMGVLMALRHVTPNEAFELLRTASQTTNRKLRDIADEVLLTGELPEAPPRRDPPRRPSPPPA